MSATNTKSTKDEKQGVHVNFGTNLGGLFGGLSDLLSTLGNLAEKGAELKKSGNLDLSSLGLDPKKAAKGVYGFSVKFGGLGSEEGVSVEPFGNIQKNDDGQTVVQDVYEPIVDVFEETDHVLVVAELPGVDEKNVTLEVQGDILVIHGERGNKKYHKEVLLPCKADASKIAKTCRSGILEVRISK
jgi:HSP20 family protein